MAELLLSPREVAAIIYDAGWGKEPIDAYIDAVRIAFAESGMPNYYKATAKGYAVAPNGFRLCDGHMVNTNTDGSRDRGILQVNDRAWPALSDLQAEDPLTCATFAYQKIYLPTKTFNAWSAFKNLTYQNYWAEAQQGVIQAWADRKRRPYYGVGPAIGGL